MVPPVAALAFRNTGNILYFQRQDFAQRPAYGLPDLFFVRFPEKETGSFIE